MPVIHLNADLDANQIALHADPRPSQGVLHQAARGTGPIVIMVHGYKYDPSMPVHCPHDRLFGPGGWPAGLGLTGEDALGIAFGWKARGPLALVFDRAGRLGNDLAMLIARLHRVAPARPLHLIAHSMGAELALSGLALAPAGSVDRVILLTGACFHESAARAMASHAGKGAELFNIVSRENDLFDFMFERLLAGSSATDRAIGQGFAARNALTVQIDCPRTLGRLAELGSEVAPSARRICHWSGYTRPGMLNFYARLLHQPAELPLDHLRALLPRACAPRWSRLPLAGLLKKRIMPLNPQERPDEHRPLLLAHAERLENIHRA